MSTIVIGVDASERSEDAVAFGRRLASVSGAHVVIGCAFPYDDKPSRASSAPYRAVLRSDALETAHRMRDGLEAIAADRVSVRISANTSPAHALHDLAHAEHAAIVVVGSSHTGRLHRITPGSTGERLLHGAPCAVAVVPNGYRLHPDEPIRRIGVAYNGSDEAKAAVAGAAGLARAFGAELEIIGVVAPESYSTPAVMSGVSAATLREDIEHHVQEDLDTVVAGLPDDVMAASVLVTGSPGDQLVERSADLDLMVTGSRGYGPLHAVIVGGVSGWLMCRAQCPVIAVPRGIEAPLEALFTSTTATTV